MNDKRRKTVENEMQNIFDSWDYHLFEKLEAADRIVQRIFTDMNLAGVPKQMQIEFMREKTQDMIDQIAENRERGIRRGA